MAFTAGQITSPDANGTANDGAEVTPSDGSDLPVLAEALYIGTAGDLHFVTSAGTELTRPVVAGIFPFKVKKVFATGTTATGLTAAYY